jgi:hypothetical protein
MWHFGRESVLKSKNISDWLLIDNEYNRITDEAVKLQHQAVQFIALTGKYLIEEKSDDSHTSMIFSSEYHGFIGCGLPNHTKLALNSIDLKLQLLTEELIILSELELTGKTKNQAFDELKILLGQNGLNTKMLTSELHYSIPEHKLDKGGKFEVNNRESLLLNNNYRLNAEIVLNQINRKFNLKTEFKVWPHHFDTGAFVPTSFKSNGELSQYIGLGFAIPDSMINEPYFYLSYWSSENINELEHPEAIAHGKWMMPVWKGAVLRISDILKEKKSISQNQMVYEFFESGLLILKPHLNLTF